MQTTVISQISTALKKAAHLRGFNKHRGAYSRKYGTKSNHNYNKIVKSDWLSTALISALIGQFIRTVRVMPK